MAAKVRTHSTWELQSVQYPTRGSVQVYRFVNDAAVGAPSTSEHRTIEAAARELADMLAGTVPFVTSSERVTF